MSGEKVSGSKTKRRSDQPVKGSRITLRILAINILALAVLVIGLLYVGNYRQGLIESEIASLMTQAEMFAAALGEGAVEGKYNEKQFLKKENADQIIRRLTVVTRTHAQLISKDGRILTDSKLLAEPGGLVQVEELPPPPENNNFTRHLIDSLDQALWQTLKGSDLSRPENSEIVEPAVTPETLHAMAGEYGHAIRLTSSGLLNISVSAPVQRYKHVLGVLNLTKDASSINDAVFEVRLEILKVFGIALLVTVLLSIYLAGTIARPIHRLASAANSIRHGLSRQYNIPDLGRRSDEIGHLSEALKDMTEALWKRMDAIERFAADVAHEIKNPLTSLRSAVETAARVQNLEHHKELMSIILDDIQRLDRLITDIADASRLDSELSRAKMETVDIGVLLNELQDLYHTTNKVNGVTISIEIINAAPMVILGLEDRIVQVLYNLLGNAESFSPINGTITVKAERIDSTIVVMVEDEGPGISESSLIKIFNRFYQERPSEEKFGTHSGLGLSISKQIIETHGGIIWGENRKSATDEVLGARFTFQLPVIS